MRNQRSLKNYLFLGLSWLSILITGSLLISLISFIFYKGFTGLNLSFITSPMIKSGLSGGIRDQLLGSLFLVLSSFILSVFLSLGFCLFYFSTIKNWKITQAWIKSILLSLNSIPSILLGIFGFFLFVKFFNLGKTWFAGTILLTMMIVPPVCFALIQAMEKVDKTYLDTAKSFGLNSSKIYFYVLLPQSLASFSSAMLLSLARIAGETAPIMFTATVFSGASLNPLKIADSPVLSLPYHIFTMVQESYSEQAIINAWASAAVLITVVCSFIIILIPIRNHLHKEANY